MDGIMKLALLCLLILASCAPQVIDKSEQNETKQPELIVSSSADISQAIDWIEKAQGIRAENYEAIANGSFIDLNSKWDEYFIYLDEATLLLDEAEKSTIPEEKEEISALKNFISAMKDCALASQKFDNVFNRVFNAKDVVNIGEEMSVLRNDLESTQKQFNDAKSKLLRVDVSYLSSRARVMVELEKNSVPAVENMIELINSIYDVQRIQLDAMIRMDYAFKAIENKNYSDALGHLQFSKELVMSAQSELNKVYDIDLAFDISQSLNLSMKELLRSIETFEQAVKAMESGEFDKSIVLMESANRKLNTASQMD